MNRTDTGLDSPDVCGAEITIDDDKVGERICLDPPDVVMAEQLSRNGCAGRQSFGGGEADLGEEADLFEVLPHAGRHRHRCPSQS